MEEWHIGCFTIQLLAAYTLKGTYVSLPLPSTKTLSVVFAVVKEIEIERQGSLGTDDNKRKNHTDLTRGNHHEMKWLKFAAIKLNSCN